MDEVCPSDTAPHQCLPRAGPLGSAGDRRAEIMAFVDIHEGGKKVHLPGVEPGSGPWQGPMLTALPQMLQCCTQCWSGIYITVHRSM